MSGNEIFEKLKVIESCKLNFFFVQGVEKQFFPKYLDRAKNTEDIIFDTFYYEVSAKNGDNIKKSFNEIIQKILNDKFFKKSSCKFSFRNVEKKSKN